jgi:hypothetical protein
MVKTAAPDFAAFSQTFPSQAAETAVGCIEQMCCRFRLSKLLACSHGAITVLIIGLLE